MIFVPVASPEEEGALDGRGADTDLCKRKRRKKPTMNERYQKPYRLGRRPGEQGPRPLSRDQGRVEKLVTGTTIHKTTTAAPSTATNSTPRQARITTATTKRGSQRLKMAKDIFTVGTWNVRTLWAAGKLELLRNEMKRYKYDVVGISEVRWTGKVKHQTATSSGQVKMIHILKALECYLVQKPENYLWVIIPLTQD